MKHSRYSWAFAAVVVALTVAALASFREISALSAPSPLDGAALRWPTDTIPLATQGVSNAPSYASLAAADAAWRAQNARQYSLAELRARGDGRRTPRQAMQ